MTFSWDSHCFTLTELFERRQFPCLVKVEAGFHGDSPWQTVSRDEVLYISRSDSHRKALAEDKTSKKCVAIPVESDKYLFEVAGISGRRQQPATLSSIVETWGLPCEVSMTSRLARHDKPRTMVEFNHLRITDVYMEHALIVYPVSNGVVYNEAAAWPTYLKIKVVTAQVPDAIMRSASSLTSDNDLGLSVITAYDRTQVTLCEGVYETLEPNLYLSLKEKRGVDNDHLYADLDEKSSQSTPGIQAISIKEVKKAKGSLKITSRKLSAPAVAKKPEKSKVQGNVYEFLHLPRRDSAPAGVNIASPDKGSIPPSNNAIVPPPRRAMVPPPEKNTIPPPDKSTVPPPGTKAGPPPDKSTVPPPGTKAGPPPDKSTVPPSVGDQSASGTSEGVPRFSRLEDVPTDIDELNTADICFCLSLLNMDEYVYNFKQQQIDGSLLKTLDAEILVSEIGVSRFNAKKLVMFATAGWRPK